MAPWIIITLVSLACSALFSGSEIAFVTGDRVRVEIDRKRSGIIGRIINRFYTNPSFFISSILVGNNVMLVVYGMGAAYLLEPVFRTWFDSELAVLVLQTVASTLVILLFGEFVPKTLSRINSNASLRVFAVPVFVFYVLFYPVSWLSTWLSKMLMHLFGVKEGERPINLLTVGDLNDYLEETIDNLEDKKEVVENEVKIFQNALDFSSTHLRDCMLPRNEIVAVNIDSTTRDDLVKLFTSTGRSKIIVYRNDIDTVLGYIHVSELFHPEADWREHLKEVLYAPETLLANKMMHRLLTEKRSIAIVVDEYGGTAGMVTLEDLVEEIFGEINDEHDKTQLRAVCIAPGVYEFAARCEIEYLNEKFDLDIPEDDDYQTLGGYILHSTGTIPDQGATVMLGNLRIEVLRKSASRLELLRVSTIDSTPNS